MENLEKDNVNSSTKKSLKWLWITLAIVVAIAIAVWCTIWAVKINGKNIKGIEEVFSFSNTFVLLTLSFVIILFGYLLGRISIKGVTLGTAGVFLVAILVGFLCTLNFQDVPLLNKFYMTGNNAPIAKTFKGTIQNIGLVLFVGSVGFIAGPNFFKDLKKNFKTYILLGVTIIFVGTLVAVICVLISGYGPEFWSGVLSGALTSTPGYAAAGDALKGLGLDEAVTTQLDNEITLGHALAYPFGVVGVVLFVQLIPKFLKTDMVKERSFLINSIENKKEEKEVLFEIEPFGFAVFGLAVILGLLVGSITIPLTAKGYNGPSFSLGTTGGVLIMCLLFGHFGKIANFSLKVNESALKVLKEFGLVLFLLGAGFDGGVGLYSQIKNNGSGIVLWGFFGGAVMTLLPMIVGFIIAKYLLKLPLLSNLGSITGGMTSTPALGTLISVSGTDNVASAYASTYPIALILIVLSSQLMITLM